MKILLYATYELAQAKNMELLIRVNGNPETENFSKVVNINEGFALPINERFINILTEEEQAQLITYTS